MMKAVCILGSPKSNGSTAAIVSAILRSLEVRGIKTSVYTLQDMNIGYCRGCKSCERTGECVQKDDVRQIVNDMFHARLVIIASPSYWGDVTGQMKVFIDRCTPYCNTNTGRLPVSSLVKGVAVAVRAGGNKQENMTLVGTIEHFLGHMDIPLVSHFTVEGIGTKEDLCRRPEVLADAYRFGEKIGCLPDD